MKCAKCGAELDPGERFCGECGQPVQVSATPSTPTGQVAIGTCPKCGANLDPGKRFCSSCGYDLIAPAQKPSAAVTYPAVPPTQPVNARTSSSSSHIALIIGGGVLVAILLLGGVGIGLWVWFGANGTEANQNTTPRATPTVSIAGTWNCVLTAPGETERGKFVLVQSGSAITGTILDEGQPNKSVDDYGEKDKFSGIFDGQKFSLKLNTNEWQLALSPDGSTMKGERQFEGQTGTLVCTR